MIAARRSSRYCDIVTASKRSSGAAILLALLFVASLTAPAGATPNEGDDGTIASFALGTLGGLSTLSFYGQQGSQTLIIPVSPGLRPANLVATVALPPNILRATMSVTQDDREISRVDLPNALDSVVTLSLAGADIVDNSVTVTLRSYVVPPDGYCVYDPTNPLRLTDVGVDFAGTGLPPAVVADFLPPILQQLTLFIPPNPSRVESDAAVALATAVTGRYGQQSLHVAVQAIGAGGSLPVPARFERQIEITEGPTSAVSIQNTGAFPSLLVTGPPADLTNQARLITSNLSGIAVSSKAVAGPIKPSAQLSTDVTTLRDIGDPGESATALTNPTVTVGIDQTRLGRPSHNIRVHLLGSYTPLPPNYGGQVTVSVGKDVISRWSAESSGAIDRWVDIPDRLVGRFTNLTVAVDAAGNTGGCGLSQPITLTIDGDSPIESTLANPPLPGGFQSLPQALMPVIEVGIGADAFADTARAARLLAELQRLSAIPLQTNVVPIADAESSKVPAVLIASHGWDDKTIELPVSRPRDAVTQIDGIDGNNEKTTLTLDPSMNFGSLQTVVDGDRTLLVATSTADPALLDSLLTWLDADQKRWPNLNGNALISVLHRDPIILTVGAAPIPKAAGGSNAFLWWTGGGLLLVVAAGACGAMLHRRSPHPDS